ncbi:DUF1330 domain-containing protein [Mesorhizobium sp. CA8]|uniref:DUF1330 domain-containing protein n=1 Tax=Mesorhizobium sp. CA8 TaxID=2876637 RepID=UPI001CCCD9C9|nr:DUF1330 domain-containing protein [Mesorhizobium sp. CA8]MBZ9761992.1 DUF1330 domain-containing protein [Mesorhizobium sp. CA8]
MRGFAFRRQVIFACQIQDERGNAAIAAAAKIGDRSERDAFNRRVRGVGRQSSGRALQRDVGTEISDQEAQAEYSRLWKPIGEKIPGTNQHDKAVASARRGARGQAHGPCGVSSLEIAKACYADPAYEQAMRFALKASNRVLVMFEGDLG